MQRTLPALLILFTSTFCCAQTSLKFCAEIGTDGKCKSAASEFTIGKQGGTITFELKNTSGLGTSKVLYKIFHLTDDGQEVFNNTIEQDVQDKWNYAWEEAVFYDPGTYKVMVYDKTDQGELICMGIIKIFAQ